MFTIHTDSHIDHSVPTRVIEWAQQELARMETSKRDVRDGPLQSISVKDGVTKVTLTLPHWADDLSCELVGPATGTAEVPEAAVTYRIRGERKCASRMVYARPTPTRQLTVIAGPHDGQPCVLFTIFGGPGAPRESGDPAIQTWEELQESRAFWSRHALAISVEATASSVLDAQRAEAEAALTDVALADRAKQVERLSQAISLLQKADELAVRALDDGALEGALLMSYVALRQQIDAYLANTL